MIQTIRARYENGRLQPLEPLEMEEGKEVTITIASEGPADRSSDNLTATAGAWIGNVPDDFEESIAADRRMASPREEPTW